MQPDERRDSELEQAVDHPVVERQSRRIGRPGSGRLDPRPGQRHPVGTDPEIGEQREVRFPAVVMVDGDIVRCCRPRCDREARRRRPTSTASDRRPRPHPPPGRPNRPCRRRTPWAGDASSPIGMTNGDQTRTAFGQLHPGRVGVQHRQRRCREGSQGLQFGVRRRLDLVGIRPAPSVGGQVGNGGQLVGDGAGMPGACPTTSTVCADSGSSATWPRMSSTSPP